MRNQFIETDLGTGRTMSVTNEDLRNDITRMTEQVRGLATAVTNLITANENGMTARDTERDRVTTLYAGLSVLRWAFGLVVTFIAGACVWTFNNVIEATNTNRTQEIRLTNVEQENRIRDARLQALERSQFAERVKER